MSNTKEKASINWHFSCQLTHIYENASEPYKVQVDCLKSLESDSYDKMIWKRKWMTWLGWQGNARKTETGTNSEQFQILTLVPECTVQNILMSLNTLFELHMKSKK